jgi:DNA-binding NtrC family response regulator/tetratricopeptide (TPR) repeat protein
MTYAKTIALATDLLANGRAEDVVRMVDPLLEPIESARSAETDQVLLHALMARVQVTHRADVEAALDLLRPFDAGPARTSLRPRARAQVTLWLGWAHALRNRHAREDAQALSLLDEAEHLFEDLPSPGGRCWCLLGKARAYFAIDEYHLMRLMLDEAAAVHAKIHDVQADRWLHDLSVPALRFQGAYGEAESHIDALLDLADRWNDQRIRGHAHAHRAALRYDLGHPPDDIIASATAAATLLERLDRGSDYPLLAAYHAHVGALLRQADWPEAEAVLDEADAAMEAYPAGQAHLQTLRARLALRRGRVEEAEGFMETLFEHVHHLPHGLQRSHVALLRGELLSRHGRTGDAVQWIERAYRNARETGHRGNQLRALLMLASVLLQDGDRPEAVRRLAEADAYDDYFDVLPYTLRRFRVLGAEAEADERYNDARAAYVQARSAAALIHDAPAAEALKARLDALEGGASNAEPEAAPDRFAATIGAALSRASVSVDLVAEAWIQGVERLLPGSWIGVFRHTDDGGWSCIHEHGARPDELSLPQPDAPDTRDDGVQWVPLRFPSDPLFFMGVATSSRDAWSRVRDRLDPWLPVLQLALDRAVRRTGREQHGSPDDNQPASIPLEGFVSESPPMADLARHIRRIHMSHSPVLITGESGTGKTLVGRAVHETSERSDGPFRHVRCANMQQDPVEERLFGRVDPDGTLTPGIVQACSGGTLLLENVATLPGPTQSALVRMLDSNEIIPQGATDAHPIDVRVIATAGPSLVSKVEDGPVRQDLYHRLNVIPLRVPPLRERREDIPLLVRHFLNTLGPRDLPAASVTSEALEALLQYDWPGNVRQLRNELERALTVVQSEPAPTIDIDLLSESLLKPDETPSSASSPSGDLEAIFDADRSLDDVLARTEKEVIEHVLQNHGGKVTASADVLGLTRQGLYKKMKRLGIDASTFQVDTNPAVARHS